MYEQQFKQQLLKRVLKPREGLTTPHSLLRTQEPELGLDTVSPWNPWVRVPSSPFPQSLETSFLHSADKMQKKQVQRRCVGII